MMIRIAALRRANFARLGNPMQDCHLRKEPNYVLSFLSPIVILRCSQNDEAKGLFYQSK